jgi:hypothetical protein
VNFEDAVLLVLEEVKVCVNTLQCNSDSNPHILEQSEPKPTDHGRENFQ